jgi:O-antigen/teichoic acid export membrane protein
MKGLMSSPREPQPEAAAPAAPAPVPSRTGRILKAVAIGYGFQLVVAATGLALTPFLLSRLGTDEFGSWLVIGQVLGLLGLLDLGVTAVLPREVARASGTGDPGAVPEVVRRATWLVWFQTPVVGLIAAGVWAGVSAEWPDLSGPLGVTLAFFVTQFPLRLPTAILTGLQDLEFSWLVQAAAWLVTTVVSVLLVLAGWGLYSLAVGWAAGQLLACLVCWVRVRTRFPAASRWQGCPGRTAIMSYLGPSFWTSVQQLARLLLLGADLIILGWAAGPAAVVVYACTVKLVSLVNNQPSLLMTAAFPAIAELQAVGDRDRLWRACRAVGLGLLLLSGGLAIAVLALNSAFVPLWVGAGQYGGPALTLLAVVGMVARHWAYTLLVTAFALGYDRVLAATSVADGVVTVVATIGWVFALGPLGVPLGLLSSLLLTSAPAAILALAAAEGVSPLRAIRWAGPWAIRFLAVAVPLAVASFTPAAENPLFAAVALAGGLGAYAVLSVPLLGREPLRGYRTRFAAALRRKLGLAPVS